MNFAEGPAGGTIALGGAQITIDVSVLTGGTTISGNSLSGVFYLSDSTRTIGEAFR